MTLFLLMKLSILLQLSSLRDNYFQKKLPFSRREGNGQSSLLVSTMTGVTAVFLKFNKSILMISLILQAIRLLMLSNLCSRSQQLKLKKFFLRRRKTYGQSFRQYSSRRIFRAHFQLSKTFF